MNQGELTQAISKRFFLTQVESGEIINFILSKITESLRAGERAYFRGFGWGARNALGIIHCRHAPVGGRGVAHHGVAVR